MKVAPHQKNVRLFEQILIVNEDYSDSEEEDAELTMNAETLPDDEINENAQQANLFILSLSEDDDSDDFNSNGHLETLTPIEVEKENYGRELQKVIVKLRVAIK